MSAKTVEGDVEIRANVVRSPSCPIRLGDQTRHFAEYVGIFCEVANPVFPLANVAGANLRLGQMVEHEPLSPETRNELHRGCQMPWINKDVVRQVAIFEK